MRLLAACVLLAALSLLLPSAPSFDPWAWIVWGREVASLDLNTVGGPSWKPLPVFFTTLFAPLAAIDEGVPPALWLVVARAGSLLAIAAGFMLARRLAGPSRAVGIGAGLLAAAGLALTPQWLRNTAHGNEVPLAVGLLFLGINHHLDGRRTSALILGFLACLLRPEVFPFLAAYGVWMWRAVPERRALVAGLAAALPLLWLVPEWIGSGNPLSAGAQARSEPSWSLSLVDQPWRAALDRAHDLAGLPLELGALVAAALAWRRRSDRGERSAARSLPEERSPIAAGGAQADRRSGEHRTEGYRPSTARTGIGRAPNEDLDRVTLALAAVAVGWLVLVVVMVEAGFSGSPRYFMPAVVLGCVLAGVGAARLVEVVPGRAAAAAVAVLLAVAAAPWAIDHGNGFRGQAAGAGRLTDVQRDLLVTVRRLGGEGAVTAPGMPRISPAFVTRMAWELEVHFEDIESSPGRGYIFIADLPTPGRPPPTLEQLSRAKPLVGAWHVRRPLEPRDATRVTKAED